MRMKKIMMVLMALGVTFVRVTPSSVTSPKKKGSSPTHYRVDVSAKILKRRVGGILT